jgi:hypothetical protein
MSPKPIIIFTTKHDRGELIEGPAETDDMGQESAVAAEPHRVIAQDGSSSSSAPVGDAVRKQPGKLAVNVAMPVELALGDENGVEGLLADNANLGCIITITMRRVSLIRLSGSPSTKTRSARFPTAMRPRSVNPNTRAGVHEAAARALAGDNPARTSRASSR